jgi:hypothetical protein
MDIGSDCAGSRIKGWVVGGRETGVEADANMESRRRRPVLVALGVLEVYDVVGGVGVPPKAVIRLLSIDLFDAKLVN